MATSRSRQATLRDVARRAGCSTAVVSTVINHAKGNTLVSDETRQRVQDAAKALGYRPNFASRSLISRRTRTLGIYIPPRPWAGVGFSYEGLIIRGVEAATQRRGYDLLLLNATGQDDGQISPRKVAERRIDGLLLIHVQAGSPWLSDILAAGANAVAVDYPQPEPLLDTIGFDNHAAGVMAVKHLAELGHRRIGFVGSCCRVPNRDAQIRQQAYIDTMRTLELPLDDRWILDAESAPRTLDESEPVCHVEAQLASQYIRAMGKDAPTAWIAYGDLVAAHLISNLQEAGLSLPRDLSIMGVDDSEWSRLTRPALTTVAHPMEAMGRAAANLLINKSEDADASPTEPQEACTVTTGDDGAKRLIFAPSLVIRQSTTPFGASRP